MRPIKDYQYMYKLREVCFTKIVKGKFSLFHVDEDNSYVDGPYGTSFVLIENRWKDVGGNYFECLYTHIKDEVCDIRYNASLKTYEIAEKVICKKMLEEYLKKFNERNL